ncbi:MAG: phage portal protein [Leptospiraceae bacterium]|nr:phage portal protein [Leptospiraceae bacterium]
MAFWNRKKNKTQYYTSLGNVGIQSQDISDAEKDYNKTTSIIYRGYQNLLEYGSSGIQNVINYRRSWIIGKDTTITCEGEKEKEFIKSFNDSIQKNILFAKFATYGEIEGKVLIILMTKNENGIKKIIPKILPYNQYKYEIYNNEFGETVKVAVNQNEYSNNKFVFVKLSLFEYSENLCITPSNVSYVVENIVNSDKAYKDWRSINDRFAKTTPIFEAESWEDAQAISNIIRGKTEDTSNPNESGKRWKIGEGLAIKGKAYSLQFNVQGVESLKDEITANAQKISGHTGIPIFLLGFPELMSNRATAKELAEGIRNKTQTERLIWQEKIKELYTKIFYLNNQINGTLLNPETLRVTIPPVSTAEIEQLISVYEPLANRKIISNQTYREMLPDIDPEIEVKRLEEEKLLEETNDSTIEDTI